MKSDNASHVRKIGARGQRGIERRDGNGIKGRYLLGESNFSLSPDPKPSLWSRPTPTIYEFPLRKEKVPADYNGKLEEDQFTPSDLAAISSPPFGTEDEIMDEVKCRDNFHHSPLPTHCSTCQLTRTCQRDAQSRFLAIPCSRFARISPRKTSKNEWIAWNGNNFFFETKNEETTNKKTKFDNQRNRQRKGRENEIVFAKYSFIREVRFIKY